MEDTGMTGYWVSVAVACQLTGKTERTIRRWISTGRLQTRQGPRGQEVDVSGCVVAQPVEVVTDDRAMAGNGELEALRAEIARLQERVNELTNERDYLRALGLQLAARPALPPHEEAPTRPWWRWWR